MGSQSVAYVIKDDRFYTLCDFQGAPEKDTYTRRVSSRECLRAHNIYSPAETHKKAIME